MASDLERRNKGQGVGLSADAWKVRFRDTDGGGAEGLNRRGRSGQAADGMPSRDRQGERIVGMQKGRPDLGRVVLAVAKKAQGERRVGGHSSRSLKHVCTPAYS
jgi:hypothetical protein